MKHDKYFNDYKCRVYASKSKYNQGNLSHNIGRLMSLIYDYECHINWIKERKIGIPTEEFKQIKLKNPTSDLTWKEFINKMISGVFTTEREYEDAINIINKQIGIMR